MHPHVDLALMPDNIKAAFLRKQIESGVMPPMLYKFRGIGSACQAKDENPQCAMAGDSRLHELISTRTLWFSSPLEFNDPFDGQLEFDAEITMGQLAKRMRSHRPPGATRTKARKRAQELIKRGTGWASVVNQSIREVMGQVGICSFTKGWQDIRLWSYYADSHRGVALGFNTAEDPLLYVSPVPVIYEPTYPKLDYEADDYACAKALITVKAAQWRHEEELRIFKQQKGKYPYKAATLAEITFGVNCPDQDVALVRRWSAQYGLTHVRFYRAFKLKTVFGLGRIELK